MQLTLAIGVTFDGEKYTLMNRVGEKNHGFTDRWAADAYPVQVGDAVMVCDDLDSDVRWVKIDAKDGNPLARLEDIEGDLNGLMDSHDRPLFQSLVSAGWFYPPARHLGGFWELAQWMSRPDDLELVPVYLSSPNRQDGPFFAVTPGEFGLLEEMSQDPLAVSVRRGKLVVEPELPPRPQDN